MKLRQIQYKKLDGLMLIARKPAKISNYKFMCAMLCIIDNGCKWMTVLKKYINWHAVYMKFGRWSKLLFFSLKPLEAMKKQKLLNEEAYLRFIDSTNIKVSHVQTRIKRIRTEHRTFKRSLTTKLHLCCTSSCPVIFRLSPGNSHNAPEGRKLTRQRSHKKQVKNKSKGDGRDKNRIELIITSKNFSKTFQSQEISFDIIAMFIKVSVITPR